MIQQDLPINQEKGPGIHKWLVLFTVCVNNIIGLMDISMITISIPELTIQAFPKRQEKELLNKHRDVCSTIIKYLL